MSVLGEGQASAPRSSTPRVWTFADCVLDERSLELKVRGLVVDVERKQLEVLLHLLRHAGESTSASRRCCTTTWTRSRSTRWSRPGPTVRG